LGLVVVVSGLGKRGPGGFTVGALQGVHGGERIFVPDMFQAPEAAWPVPTVAPVASDVPYSATGLVRAYVDSGETSIGFSLKIPAGVTTMVMRMPGRAGDAPAAPGQVVMRLHARVGVGAWIGPTALGVLAVPNDLAQSWSFSTTLAGLGLGAGNDAQFILSRNPGSASDTLVGRWFLYELGVNFA